MKNENSDTIDRILKEIGESEDSLIKIGNKKISTNLYEHAKLVDFFLSNYGLGGCRSLKEFWDMVDNEDPTILILLELAAVERINKRLGGKGFDGRSIGIGETITEAFGGGVGKSNSTEVQVNDDNVMAEFLYQMGADRKRIDDGLNKSRNRKIASRVDLSDITSSNMVGEEFDIEDALRRLKDNERNAVKIIVSRGTLMNRQRGK